MAENSGESTSEQSKKQSTRSNYRERLIEDIKEHVKCAKNYNESSNIFEVRMRMQALTETYTELVEHFQQQEKKCKLDETTAFAQAIENRTYQTKVMCTKAKLMELLPEYATQPEVNESLTNRSRSDTDNSNDKPRRRHNLPKITIPTFTGNYEDWNEFEELFTALVIDDDSLTEIEKLQYLRSHLAEGPANSIRYTINTEKSFKAAWKLLKNRYGVPRALIDATLKKFLDISPLKTNDAAGLRSLIDTTSATLTSLEMQNISIDSWDPIIIHILTQKLDEKTIQHWEDSLLDVRNYPSLGTFFNFLENRIIIEQRIQSRTSQEAPKPEQKSAKAVNLVTQNRIPKCTLCGNAHRPFECKQLSTISVPERLKLVRKHELCENCLYKHKSSDCKSRFSCRSCQQKHHTLLHTDKLNNEQTSSSSENLDNTTKVLHSQKYQNNINSILATAMVPIITPTGENITVRALLDQGSQANFITERTAKMLKQKPTKVNIPVVGISNSKPITIQNQTTITIGSIHNNQFQYKMQTLILPHITNVTPNHGAYGKKWPHAEKIPLADPNHTDSGEIDLLIGAAAYGHLLLYGVRKGGKNRPILQETQLGWIISGACSNNDNSSATISAVCTTNETEESEDQKLSHLFKQFFDSEMIPNTKQEMSEEDKQAEESFTKNLKRHPNGKFIVGLPFKLNPHEPNFLGDSYKPALVRFLNTERNLNKNTELKKQYANTIKEYIELGHMRAATMDDKNHPWKYYVPHHAVFKLDSETTKLRVVYDASSKSTNGKSLNDQMLIGAKIQRNLFDTLLQWRKYPIAFCADIEKMYRQIYLQDPDAKFQRILWRDNENEPISEYIIHTVMFGNAAAPFLAIRSLFQISMEIEDKKIAEMIRNNFYVDDFFGGAETPAEAVEIQIKISKTLEEYGFPLRKWKSNSLEFLTTVEGNSSRENIKLKFEQTHKSLGIQWNPDSDQFTFNFQLDELPKKLTKRALASYVMRIFDPLGFLAPVVITAKNLLKCVWQLPGFNWDDELPNSLQKEWSEFHNNINKCSSIQIPRWIRTSSNATKFTLHGFADASEKAYAAAIYLTVADSSGNLSSTIVASKTRVAPIKLITIARLELCAAVLAAELLQTTKAILQLPQIDIFLWSDSTIVLSWIASPASRWKTYVANRVTRIHELSEPVQWRHINSERNPSDCATRGLSLSELKEHPIWWNGPSFLVNHNEAWPPLFSDFITGSREERKLKAFTTMTPTDNQFLLAFDSLYRLQFVTAYALRWRTRQPGPIIPTTDQLREALWHWIRIIQADTFPAERKALMSKGVIPSKSRILSLSPIWHESDQLIRVGGRLQKSHLTRAAKHPIILPSSNHLTVLLIRNAHHLTLHSGVNTTLRLLRDRYWIVHDKTAVKKVLHQCVTCFRFKQQTASQLMGNLPAARVQISRPFTHTGVDFAGYFEVKMSDQRNAAYMKCYVALFICLTTKAIHLELVRDLSTQSFIEAVKDFVARKGIPSHIYSDNGKNFVGANNELPQLLSDQRAKVAQDVAHSLSKMEIQWHFNPSQAPHFGGIWEANIKCMKLHLSKLFKDRKLKFDEFHSILVRIEATLNSRPLYPLSSDINDDQVITPGHLLQGYAINTLPEPDISDEPVNKLSRYQYRSRLHQEFWRLWSSDYLHQLQIRSKWQRVQSNTAIGQLVLIREENLPPTRWIMGRIVRVFAGPDKLVRSAEVLCRGNIISRPIHKLCILPTEDNQKLQDISSASKGGKMDERPK